MELENLKKEYHEIEPNITQFLQNLSRETMLLLSNIPITLGIPIEIRVKEWSSITGKIERDYLTFESILELEDIAGLRIVLLFRRDIAQVENMIEKAFEVLKKEDTFTRLDEAHFGYQSIHYLIRLKPEWLIMPSFKSSKEFQAEIQLRTMTQHIWAAASHKLQYHHEDSVPIPVRRSIHRVSALLEIVDLEFERVLLQRDDYIKDIDTERPNQILNVDLLAQYLDSVLPEENKKEGDEDYDELLEDLFSWDISTVDKLSDLVDHQLSIILQDDKNIVKRIHAGDESYEPDAERLAKGVYLCHVGLVRKMITRNFGMDWQSKRIQAMIKLQEENMASESLHTID